MALSDGSHFHGRRSLWVRSGRGRTRYPFDPVARDPFQTWLIGLSPFSRVPQICRPKFSNQNWLYCSITAPKSGKRKIKLSASKNAMRHSARLLQTRYLQLS
jgi:hypothetical protein